MKMKRKLSAFLALILACGTTLSLTACGGGSENPNTQDDLEIFYWDSGQGSEWLDKTIAAFEKANPTVNIVKNYNVSNTTWENELVNEETNTIDLYINSMATLLAYTDYLEPLDSIMEERDENGTKYIDKFDPAMLDAIRGQDGKLYAVNWGGGVCSIAYNKTAFDKHGWDVPRTTKELSTLAGKIKEKGYDPFIFCGNADYWTYAYMVWAAQYGGIDEFNDFWNVKYKGEELTIDAFTTDARLEALKALEEVASPTGYTYAASNSTNHTQAQTYFLQGTGLMMPNGSWLENEMRNTSSNVEIAFMRVPIISSIVDKFESTVSDKVLAEIVSYVDSGDTEIKSNSTEYKANYVRSVPEEVIEEVRKARKIVYTEATSNKAGIPNYANAKEWAKKFIQFMNTEEGLSYYYNTLQTPTLATPTTEINTKNWTPFMKSALALTEDATFVFRNKANPFFYNNGLEFYPEYPQTYILAKTGRMKAEKFWEEKCVKVYENSWDAWTDRSGLK